MISFLVALMLLVILIYLIRKFDDKPKNADSEEVIQQYYYTIKIKIILKQQEEWRADRDLDRFCTRHSHYNLSMSSKYVHVGEKLETYITHYGMYYNEIEINEKLISFLESGARGGFYESFEIMKIVKKDESNKKWV